MTTHDEKMEVLARDWAKDDRRTEQSRAHAAPYGERQATIPNLPALNEEQLLKDRAFALSQLISEGRGREVSQVYPDRTVAEEAAWTLHLLHVYKVL